MSITAALQKTRSTAIALCAAGLVLGACGSDPENSAAQEMSTTASSVDTGGPADTKGPADTETVATIADAWVKATAGADDTSMTAAFGVLTNSGDKDLTIVSATNDVTDRTELHEMAMVDGAMVMRPIEGGIKIPAGGSTTLEPGGLHVMIMDAPREIGPGDDVSVTLTFDDDTTLSFTAQAKDFAGANEEYDGDMDMDMGPGADGSGAMESADDDMPMGSGPSAEGNGSTATGSGKAAATHG